MYLCSRNDDDDDNDDRNDDPDDDFHLHVLPEVLAFNLDGCALELFSSLLKKIHTSYSNVYITFGLVEVHSDLIFTPCVNLLKGFERGMSICDMTYNFEISLTSFKSICHMNQTTSGWQG